MSWDSSAPEGVSVASHTSESEELEDEDEESLEESDAMPVASWRSTLSASAAKSGLSCFKMLRRAGNTNGCKL